jgi:hypothetical protein
LLADAALSEDAIRMGSLHRAGESSYGYQHDWALFKINSNWPSDGNETTLPWAAEEKIHVGQIASVEASRPVIVATGRRAPTRGSVSSTPTFVRAQGSYRFHKLWTVIVDDALGEFPSALKFFRWRAAYTSASSSGDCGSWVIDSDSGYLVGVVVAGLLHSHLAYLVDATQLFDDIFQSTGTWPSLSRTPRSPSPPNSPPDLYSGPWSGRLTVRVAETGAIGSARRPYMVISLCHSEHIARGPERSGFEQLPDTESGSKSIQIPGRSDPEHGTRTSGRWGRTGLLYTSHEWTVSTKL